MTNALKGRVNSNKANREFQLVKRNSGVKVEDGPGAVKVSIVYEPSTVTPVIVLMRSESLTYFIEDILMIDYE